jgi:hypothetical protein
MGQHHRHRLAQPGNCVQLTLRNPQPPTTRKTLTGRNRRHPDRSGPLSYPATTITTHRPPAAPANPHPAPRAKSGLALLRQWLKGPVTHMPFPCAQPGNEILT